ncbi:MAG: hypothetical protein ACKOE2_14110, partial [Actinomycetales bacterium]
MTNQVAVTSGDRGERRRTLRLPAVLDSRAWALPATLLWIAVLASSYVHLLQPGRFMGDLATYFAPVKLFEEGFPGPYVGFIDIKPPLLFGLMLPVATATRGQLLVFLVYDIIWWLIIAISTWAILRHLVQRF